MAEPRGRPRQLHRTFSIDGPTRRWIDDKLEQVTDTWIQGKAIRAAGEAAKGLLSTKPVAIAILTAIGLAVGWRFMGKGQEAAVEATNGIFGSIFEAVAGEEGRTAWEMGFRKAIDFWKRVPGFGAVIP